MTQSASSREQVLENFKAQVRRAVAQVRDLSRPSEECANFPTHVHIGPTNICNLRCVHCHNHVQPSGRPAITRARGLMSLEVHNKVIDEMAPLRGSVTYAIHGEPTLHPKFLDMLAYAKGRGLYVSLLTNGTRVDKAMARRLVELGLNRIVFSFDAVDKELYESIRVGANYEKTLANVLNFLRENHLAGHPTHVCLSVVLQQRTQPHIEAYKEFFGRLPVDKVFVSSLLNISGGSGTSDEIDMGALRTGDRADWPICRVPWENLAVTWSGEVAVCPLDYNLHYCIGDVSGQSLASMWNNEAMRRFRRGHLERDYSAIEAAGPLCGSCNCLFDPEYDLRRFPDFAVETIARQALQAAPGLARPEGGDGGGAEEKYENLLAEIARAEQGANRTEAE